MPAFVQFVLVIKEFGRKRECASKENVTVFLLKFWWDQ